MSKRGRKIKKYAIDGKYKPLKDWAEEYGIPFSTLYRRVNVQKMELIKAISCAPRSKPKELTAFGRTQTIAAWADEFALDTQLIKRRLAKGMTARQALLAPISQDENRYSYEGQVKSLLDWAREYDIPIHVARKRMDDGWSLYKTLTWPVEPPQKATQAKTEREAIARERSINPITIRTRLHRGWSREKALTTPVRRRHGIYTYQGQTQPLKDWGEQYNIPTTTILNRLSRGWTFKKALITPSGKRPMRPAVPTMIGGLTVREACKTNGISTNPIYRRIIRGMTPEEALKDALKTRAVHPRRWKQSLEATGKSEEKDETRLSR